MKRIRVLAAVALLAGGAGILPALAHDDVGASVGDEVDAEVESPSRSPTQSATPGPGESAPPAGETPRRTAERPQAEGERLRLACTGVAEDGRRGIACKWSASEHPDFAGYVLRRGGDGTRRSVFATRDRTHTHHFDTEVQPGISYVYVIHVLNAQAEVIGQGGPVRAQIDRRHEELRMACAGREGGITCEWSASHHPDFAGYVLWRGGDETRTTVFRTGERSDTRFLDTEVEPGVTYIYAVHVLDEHGEVIGSGGPARARTAEREPRASASPADDRAPR